MKLHTSLTVFYFFIAGSVAAQTIIEGRLLNQVTREAIAYANIGIRNASVGTISNPDGTFSLRIPQKHWNDTLTFSSIGFASRQIPVSYFRQHTNVTVALLAKTTVLEELVFTGKREKNKTFELGNQSVRGGVLETDTLYAGGSTALLIDGAGEKKLSFPVYLEKASLRIFRNNLSSFKFRVRIQERDPKNGLPGRDILEQSVVAESTMKNGWLEFDLSDLNQVLYEPFFVTFEQILDKTDRTRIADGYRAFIQAHPEKLKIDTVEFEGKKEVRQMLKGGGIDLPGTFVGVNPSRSDEFTCYVRETSLGEWTKVRGIISAYVTVSNQGTKGIKTAPCESVSCKADAICQNLMDETGLAGLQLCVSKNNQVAFSLNKGYADVTNSVPVTNGTRFRINSVSKSVTSVALLTLMEARQLDLDVPVQRYVPGFPLKKHPITTRQLAGHLAGIRDYRDLNDFVQQKHYTSMTDALEVFKNDSLLFKPGSEFSYSSFGWNLIGAVIEGASGENYVDYMQKHVWSPWGLTNTDADDTHAKIPNRSKFYDEAGEENEYGDWSYKYAGGGLLSTAEDLVKFGNEILNGKKLDPGLKKFLFESQRIDDGKETGYGLGWYAGFDRNGHRIWHHSGDSFSSSSHLIIYPDHNMVIAFLGNSQAGAAFDLQMVADLILTH